MQVKIAYHHTNADTKSQYFYLLRVNIFRFKLDDNNSDIVKGYSKDRYVKIRLRTAQGKQIIFY